MDLTSIEVEYRVYRQRQAYKELPAEYCDLILFEKPIKQRKPSAWLLMFAETLIRAGVAIKNSQLAVANNDLIRNARKA